MLNVHQVRLRFIFARALYLRRLFQKAYGKWYFRTAKDGRWFYAVASFLPKKLVVEKRTRKYAFQQPAGVFCTLLASASSISKGLRRVCFTICRY